MSRNSKGSWRETEERFINPYNFIPFAGTCERKEVSYAPGKLTGYLDCQLQLLTPLFIPNTSNSRALHEDKDSGNLGNSYDFFSYTDLGTEPGAAVGRYSEPVIPGSEIRGAVRSVFEAAFNGCMSSVDLERTLGRRAPKPKDAGILRKDGKGNWTIFPCQRWMLNTTNHCQGKNVGQDQYKKWKEGQRLYVRSNANYSKNGRDSAKLPPVVSDWQEEEIRGDDWQEGYLHKGEPFGRKKHHESVFVEDKKKKPIPVSEDDMNMLKEVVEQYQDSKMNIHIKKDDMSRNWYAGYNVGGDFLPVYYLEVRTDNLKRVYMAPACIGKEVFANRIEHLLRENGSYQPCIDRDCVCPACALFGMIPKKETPGDVKKSGRASRVRFEDAKLFSQPAGSQWKEYYWPDIILPEMGEPKPSAVEFYTLPPEEKKEKDGSYGYWTYDYQIREKNQRELLPKNKPALRGRKFYWHSESWRKYMKGHQELSNMKQKIRPLRERLLKASDPTTFQFKVYFENITLEELTRLHWALTFDDAGCAHKIGRAKPLGFGSVRMEVDGIYQREISKETGEWSCRRTDQKLEEVLMAAPIEALKIMASWESVREGDVVYPRAKEVAQSSNINAQASHQWFNGNRSRTDDASTMYPKFAKVLPKPEEEVDKQAKDKHLHKLEKMDNQRQR